MIGRVGELVVFHWLKDHLRKQDVQRWGFSRFGALQNGKAWSESLGYDFEPNNFLSGRCRSAGQQFWNEAAGAESNEVRA